MKKTEIFKQSFTVSNDFNKDACVKAISNQLGDAAFKELINGEKHSLTLDFSISVNELETNELDSRLLSALKVIDEIKNLPIDKAKNPSTIDLLMLYHSASKIDTSLLKKHKIELP
jgi:hypothetical protein